MVEQRSSEGYDPDRERIAQILRAAWDPQEEPVLEDETRRLMLHLAIEPYDDVAVRRPAAPEPPPVRTSLMRRMLQRLHIL